MGLAKTQLERDPGAIQVHMLGRLGLCRNSLALELPASRKLRALFAYLALAPRPVGRSRLCELLWAVPNDPRGELRWCLSKLRAVLDEEERQRVVTAADAISLRLDDCFVDVLEIAAAVQKGLSTLDADHLRALSGLFRGEFLEGLEVSHSPLFDNWLAAQRRQLNASQAAILEHLVRRLPADSDEILEHLEAWAALLPFDPKVHWTLLEALFARGRLDEGEQHLAVTAHLFETEGLDFEPVRRSWLSLREGRPPAGRPAAAIDAHPMPFSPAALPETALAAPRRASLAVMPFVERTLHGGVRGGRADGLTHDIITRLAKLRGLFIIARGSVFALAEHQIGPEEAGRRLNVEYVVSGDLHREERRIVVTVELVETRSARIVWSDSFEHAEDDTFLVLDQIGDRIVSAIAHEIETFERNQAILKPPNSLDAWEAYHRGLWHMYRFTQADNEEARRFFQMATEIDPTFARPYSGLSFTHWQSAFQRWEDLDQQVRLAVETAGHSLLVDEHDPSAHWAMGRAQWLAGRHQEGLFELGQAVDLSPNFALGHYALAFVQSQSGDPQAAIGAADRSRDLSPFDPLLFAMLSTRAIAHVRLGEFHEAAEWAMKAAARPNAHPTIMAIAAHCLALDGRLDEARSFVAAVRSARPGYRSADFLATFHFTEDAAARFKEAARLIGLD